MIHSSVNNYTHNKLRLIFILFRLFIVYSVFIVILFFFLPLYIRGDIVYYESESSISEIKHAKKDSLDFVTFEDASILNRCGKPRIPVKFINLIIPPDCKIYSIDVNTCNLKELEGEFTLATGSSNGHQMQLDSNYYSKRVLYPGMRVEIVGKGSISGNSILQVAVYHVDYSHYEHAIYFYENIKFFIYTSVDSRIKIRQLYSHPYSEKIKENILHELVSNDDMITDYQVSSVYSVGVYLPDSSPVAPEYIVITSEEMKESFKPLTNWLKKKGIEAKVVTVYEILNIYYYDPVSGITDDAGAIRGFLMDAFQYGTQWVLLGGDESKVPIRYGTSENNANSVEERPPSDLYYADLDGNWNVDGDELYGEPIDDDVDCIKSADLKTNTVEVNVKSRNLPIENAYVCLWKKDKIYERGFTDENGYFTANITEKVTGGELYLTVTGNNLIPYEDAINLTSSSYVSEKDDSVFCSLESLNRNYIEIEFYIPDEGIVNIDVFDASGRKVGSIAEKFKRGKQKLDLKDKLSVKDIPSGVYFYRFRFSKNVKKGKFLLLK